MKNKGNTTSVILLVIVILIQLLFVHTGIAMNTAYAIGTPISLIALLTPTTNPITGKYKPTNYYSGLFTFQYMEHATRSAMTNEQIPDYFNIDGHDTLQNECLIFALIWVFLIIEFCLAIKCYKHSSKAKYLILLAVPVISVNIWAELLYVLFGYMNAVVSFGIAFLIYLVVYSLISSTDRKEKEYQHKGDAL